MKGDRNWSMQKLICLCTSLSNTFETPGRTLTGLEFVFVGSSFLKTGVTSAHFNLSGK